MNPRRLIIHSFAALLTAATLHAQTWDGGGVNDLFNTANNWNPNAVPLNNGTASLTFGGAVRLTPSVNVNFDVSGVIFNNTAGAFNIGTSGGTTLTVRGGGITNNDADTQTFSTPVTFATGSAITATSGNLAFTGAVGIGTNTVTVSGNFDTSMSTITGTGLFVKNGTGVLSISSGLNQTYGLSLNAGTVSYGGSTTFSGTSAALALVGGTLAMGSNMTLSSGASLDVDSAATFTLPASRTMTVQSASTFTYGSILATAASDVYRITGTGSTMTTAGFALRDGSSFEVLSGGKITTTGASQVGAFGTTGSILVDGTTSSFTATNTFTIGTGAGSNGSMTFNNGATGSFPSISLTLGSSGATNGSLSVRGGAQVSTGTVEVAQTTTSGTANVLVSGPGSTLTATFNIADFSIGATSGSSGTVTVEDGGLVTLGGPLTINETGTLNINGGIVTMAVSQPFTNHGALNFTSGRFTLGEDLGVGSGTSAFGSNITLPAGKEIVVPSSRTTTIGPAASIVIDGGVFSTGTLVNSGGTLDFRRGTLRLTGSAAVSIGTGGPLGANVSVPLGSTLSISSSDLSVASTGLLTVAGGNFSAGTFTNLGTTRIQSGIATISSLLNSAGGQMIVEGNLGVTNTLTNASGGRLELVGGSGRITAVSLANSGLILGDGTIAAPTTNNIAGKIRVDAGKTIYFTSSFGSNAGELNLQGGTLDFTGAITNGATGFISGRGAIYATGITNNGQMAFSAGTADLHGDVTNAAGARITTSGGATTTFFDDVVHNGAEIRTSAGSASVFFGAVSGAGPFTGTGTVYFEGDLRPGNSPASVLYEGDLVFGGSSSLTLEIGGRNLGAQYDHLNVGGALHADGNLVLALLAGFTPQLGDTFDLFDVGTFAGDFDSISAPALSGGHAWDFSALKTTGAVTVVPEPSISALLLVALGSLGLRRRSQKSGL